MSLPLRIIFDFSCPYCYLAWGFVRKLGQTTKLSTEWIPWEIHPDVPLVGAHIQDVVEGVNLSERREKLNTLGSPVGLAPGEKVFVPNTRLALRGLEFAKEFRRENEWVDAVFNASYIGGKNIGDIIILEEIVQRVGLDLGQFRKAMNEGRFGDVLLKNDQECAAKQVEWVPTFFIGGEKIIEGAFTYAAFEEKMLSVSTNPAYPTHSL